MKQLDLDDLPPRAAQLLAGLEAGEVLVLVQNGLVVGRLGPVPSPPLVPGAEQATDGASTLTGQARAAEIFEQFRSLMEDEF
jgi:antitoxin (DNA-binding transcriptional repressor) of toxin-antitoxin stability system